MKPDNSNDIASDIRKSSENTRASNAISAYAWASPTHTSQHPYYVTNKYGLNIVTLKAELTTKQLRHANDELAQSEELSHPNHAKQNLTY